MLFYCHMLRSGERARQRGSRHILRPAADDAPAQQQPSQPKHTVASNAAKCSRARPTIARRKRKNCAPRLSFRSGRTPSSARLPWPECNRPQRDSGLGSGLRMPMACGWPSNFGINLVTQTTRYGLAEVFHEDTLYYRCECDGFGHRLEHALISTVTARTRRRWPPHLFVFLARRSVCRHRGRGACCGTRAVRCDGRLPHRQLQPGGASGAERGFRVYLWRAAHVSGQTSRAGAFERDGFQQQ